ncbi:MAG: S41 family peptidase [Clostridia bacterium]|nr:S41 family peptidase [Clostridia bacterium]
MDQEELEREFEEEKANLKVRFILITIFVAIVVAVIASEVTMMYYTNRYGDLNKIEKGTVVAENKREKNIDVIAETLTSFREVIDREFIGEIDENKVLDETIKGYVNGLGDEYSEYLTVEDWEEFQTVALGNYVGIGIYMSTDKNDNVVVVEPIKESPAEKVGIKAGDVIVGVNDESVIGAGSEYVSNKIKGEEGTKVKVTIERNGEYLDFDIERKAIKVYHVETEMLENNIGYISLATFDEGCAEEFKKEYLELKNEGAKKIIVDLRNNTGGLVEEALSLLDLFLPKNTTTLVTVDSKGNKDYSKTKDPQLITEDVVVLVNEYSASASEIVAGALKDHKRAQVVGTKTYGKGVIQSVFMLEDGSALKLTVEEYFTPKEVKINKVGIEPNHTVELDIENQIDTQLNKAKELLK